MEALMEAVLRTYHAQRALGHSRRRTDLCDLVSDPQLPRIFDANHVSGLRARSDAEIDQLLREVDAHFAYAGHRQYACDPTTSPRLEARLVSLGYDAVETLQLIAPGTLRLPACWKRAPVQLRVAESEADWEFLLSARRLNHVEQDPARPVSDYTPEVTRGLHACARKKSPPMRYLIARLDGRDCAYGALFVGEAAMGMVEDVFTLPSHRRRGVATSLILHCMELSRQQGAATVMIGGHRHDTPKDMYAAMGFAPLCMTRNYIKHG